MSIFSGCKSYAGKWQVKSVSPMPQEDIEAVSSAHLVNSDYGLSVCFIMKTGNLHFIPLDQNSEGAAGDAVDVSKASVVVLGKQGEADIQRIRL